MPSRVSTAQMFNVAQNHIQTAKEREASSAVKAATQREVTKPSQAPAEWTIAANLKDDLSVREAVAKNASLATHFMTAAENTIAQVQDIVQHTQELTIKASGNPIAGPEAYGHILPEVEGLYGNLISALNTKFGDRPVFGGWQSFKAPFDETGEFQADNGRVEVEIDRGLKVAVNVSGQQVIMGAGLENGINLIDAYHRLLEGLKTQDVSLVQSTLDDLSGVMNQLSLGRTQLAGSQTEIQRVLQTHQVHEEQGRDAVAKIEEADPVKVFSDLARDQTVLRAAIESNAKVLQNGAADILFK